MKQSILIFTIHIGICAFISAQCFNDNHSAFEEDSWLSCTRSVPEYGSQSVHWINYDFGAVYKLDTLTIWNYNVWGSTQLGAREIKLFASTDNSSWQEIGEFTLTRAPGSWKYNSPDILKLDEVQARFIGLNIISTYAEDDTCAGIGEVLLTAEELTTNIVSLPNAEWSIYPNPASDNLNISFPIDGNFNQLLISNNTGVVVRRVLINTNNDQQINLEGIPNGMYAVTLSSEKHTIVKKLVIMR